MVNPGAFCYIERAMRQLARTMSSPRRSAVLTAVIVGSLCFSVGEGLRLTPFSVSQIIETNDLAPVSAKYGPVNVPSPVQKRSKRQTADFASEPAASGSELVTFLRHDAASDSIQSRSSRIIVRPAGRAPPLVS